MCGDYCAWIEQNDLSLSLDVAYIVGFKITENLATYMDVSIIIEFIFFLCVGALISLRILVLQSRWMFL